MEKHFKRGLLAEWRKAIRLNPLTLNTQQTDGALGRMDSFTIRKSIFIEARPETIFDALTRYDEIVKYFPLKKVTSDCKAGGEILFDGEIKGKEIHRASPVTLCCRAKSRT